MTITIEPKEVEHFLIFCSLTVALLTLCYICHLTNNNNDK